MTWCVWNLNPHYRVRRSPSSAPILSHINPSNPISSRYTLILLFHVSLGLPNRKSVSISHLCHACYCPAHLILLHLLILASNACQQIINSFYSHNLVNYLFLAIILSAAFCSMKGSSSLLPASLESGQATYAMATKNRACVNARKPGCKCTPNFNNLLWILPTQCIYGFRKISMNTTVNSNYFLKHDWSTSLCNGQALFSLR
jgi:hypothetical protein